MYAYKGVNQAGRPTRGTVTAEGPRAARSKMRATGVFLTELNESEGEVTSAAVASPTHRGLNFEFNLPVRIPALEKAMADLAQAAYGGAGGPGAPGGGGAGPTGGAPGGKKKDGDVIDAEFEESN